MPPTKTTLGDVIKRCRYNIKPGKKLFKLIPLQRHSFQRPKTAKKSKTHGRSRHSDASQVLEVKRVEQVLGVRVDVDGLLLDSRNLVTQKVGKQQEGYKRSLGNPNVYRIQLFSWTLEATGY